jgi:hypothetical protein
MKVVISPSGDFRVSDKLIIRYAELCGIKLRMEKSKWGGNKFIKEDGSEYIFYSVNSKVDRRDPNLIKAVEELGKECNYNITYGDIQILDLPDDLNWKLVRDNGYYPEEYIEECHREWHYDHDKKEFTEEFDDTNSTIISS